MIRPHQTTDPADGPTDGIRPGTAVVLAGVAVVGLVLRFATRSDLWLDEALSVNIAALPLDQLTDALRQDGHPPLYYVLLHGWMSLVGDTDVAVRSLSAVASILTVAFVWVMARRRRGQAAAGWAIALCIVLPFNVRYATEARMYALVMLLVAVGWWVLDNAVRSASWRWLAGVAVVSALLLYTHYWAMWLLAATGLVLLAVSWRGPTELRRGAIGSMGAIVVGGLTFLPWVPVLLDQMAHTGTPWGDPQRPSMSIAVAVRDIVGGNVIAEGDLALVVVGILLLFGVTATERPPWSVNVDLRTVPGVRADLFTAGLALAIGSSVAFVTGSTFASRYAAIAVPVLVVVIAVGIVALPAPVPRAVVGGVAVALLAVVSTAGYFDQRTQGQEVAAAVAAGAGPGDVVLVCPDQLGPAFARYLDADVEVLTHPALTGPERVDWRDYAERNAAGDTGATVEEILRRAGDSTVWLVWMSGYETYGSQCEEIRTRLGDGRDVTPVVAPRSDVFEPMALDRFDLPG